MDAKKTGALIARRRRQQGLSQGELAQRLHVTAGTIGSWNFGNPREGAVGNGGAMMQR